MSYTHLCFHQKDGKITPYELYKYNNVNIDTYMYNINRNYRLYCSEEQVKKTKKKLVKAIKRIQSIEDKKQKPSLNDMNIIKERSVEQKNNKDKMTVIATNKGIPIGVVQKVHETNNLYVRFTNPMQYKIMTVKQLLDYMIKYELKFISYSKLIEEIFEYVKTIIETEPLSLDEKYITTDTNDFIVVYNNKNIVEVIYFHLDEIRLIHDRFSVGWDNSYTYLNRTYEIDDIYMKCNNETYEKFKVFLNNMIEIHKFELQNVNKKFEKQAEYLRNNIIKEEKNLKSVIGISLKGTQKIAKAKGSYLFIDEDNNIHGIGTINKTDNSFIFNNILTSYGDGHSGNSIYTLLNIIYDNKWKLRVYGNMDKAIISQLKCAEKFIASTNESKEKYILNKIDICNKYLSLPTIIV